MTYQTIPLLQDFYSFSNKGTHKLSFSPPKATKSEKLGRIFVSKELASLKGEPYLPFIFRVS